MAKILCVDDAAFMRKVVKDALSKNGYTDLYEAVDSADAVDKFTGDYGYYDAQYGWAGGPEGHSCEKPGGQCRHVFGDGAGGYGYRSNYRRRKGLYR